MRVGWQTTRLGNVLAVLKNGLNCKQDKSGRGQKISRIESISQASFDLERVGYAEISDQDRSKFKLTRGDILFSHINSPAHVGKTAVFDIDEEVYHGVNLLLMRPTPAVSAAYLELYLKYLFERGYWLSVCKQSVNQASVNQQDISRVPFVYPVNLVEQARIVAILEEVFEAVATARANVETNLVQAQDLFDCALQSLLADSSGERVQHNMADVCGIASKLVDPREDAYQDLPHVGAGNIEAKTGVLIDVLTARQEQLMSGKFLFDESMVLYSKIRPYLMKVVRPDFSGLCSADIYPLAPKPGVIIRDYLFYVLLSPEFTEYAIKGSARAGMPKVNREHLFGYELSLPSVQKQEWTAATLDKLAEESRRLIAVYERKLATLEELKKSLLHQAFSGQMTAAEADYSQAASGVTISA